MTDPAALPPFAPPEWRVPPQAHQPPPPPPGERASVWARWAPVEDLRVGAAVVAVLTVVGAVLGVVWQWWSPPGPRAYIIKPGSIQPDETEAFIAADGRFAVLAIAVGLLAAIVMWRRTSTRGPVAVTALGVGGLLGAAAMAGVGRLLGGGSDAGKANTLLEELPLRVHLEGLLLLEAAVAVLVYSLFASFAVADDLGRPDPFGPPPPVRDQAAQE